MAKKIKAELPLDSFRWTIAEWGTKTKMRMAFVIYRLWHIEEGGRAARLWNLKFTVREVECGSMPPGGNYQKASLWSQFCGLMPPTVRCCVRVAAFYIQQHTRIKSISRLCVVVLCLVSIRIERHSITYSQQ